MNNLKINFQCLDGFPGAEHFVPYACRNWHCPRCQAIHSMTWFEKQRNCLLPIEYFHLVFTLPHSLNPLISQNRKILHNLLFQCVSATLLQFGKNTWGVRIGVTAVLHTWGQTLIDHHHLHCIVGAGGVSLEDSQTWIAKKGGYLFPVKALSKVYRARYLKGLRRLFEKGELSFHGKLKGTRRPENFEKLLTQAASKKWVVYAKRPFAGPERLLKYLARYTHKVGIFNARLHSLDRMKRTVAFKYRDYAEDGASKIMTLSYQEFIRRLAMHILPPRFVKIRHYGYLSNRGRTERIGSLKAQLGLKSIPSPEETEPIGKEQYEELRCPHCGRVALRMVAVESGKLKNRSPPSGEVRRKERAAR